MTNYIDYIMYTTMNRTVINCRYVHNKSIVLLDDNRSDNFSIAETCFFSDPPKKNSIIRYKVSARYIMHRQIIQNHVLLIDRFVEEHTIDLVCDSPYPLMNY